MAPSLGKCLSLCLSLCISVISVCLSDCLAASHVPDKMRDKMRETIKPLLQGQSQFNGTPVFSRELLNDSKMEDGDKRIVLAKVLEVYEKLFDEMSRQLPNNSQSEEKKAEVAGILKYLQEMVTLLNKKYQYHLLVTRTLEQLGRIQTNSSVVQHKALWELPWLYDAASSLAGRKRRSLRCRRAPRKRALPVLAKLRRTM